MALLAAVDQAHRRVDRGTVSAGDLEKRARQVSEGTWAAKAVRDAVSAAQAAMLASVAAAGAVAAGSS